MPQLSRWQLRVCMLAACLKLGCDIGARPPANVILISIDTLRPDHLGCYGYEYATSPAIDAFCADAIVFDQAIAHAPSTLPSHASIFTSLLPHHHGASWSTRKPPRTGASSPRPLYLTECLLIGPKENAA